MIKGYKIITLCGSTKFKEDFIKIQKELTLKGCIVISLGFFEHSLNDLSDEETKKTMALLKEIHRRKIDLCDEIYVINVNGYIGDSTKSEIQYAKKNGKKINYLVENIE